MSATARIEITIKIGIDASTSRAGRPERVKTYGKKREQGPGSGDWGPGHVRSVSATRCQFIACNSEWPASCRKTQCIARSEPGSNAGMTLRPIRYANVYMRTHGPPPPRLGRFSRPGSARSRPDGVLRDRNAGGRVERRDARTRQRGGRCNRGRIFRMKR